MDSGTPFTRQVTFEPADDDPEKKQYQLWIFDTDKGQAHRGCDFISRLGDSPG